MLRSRRLPGGRQRPRDRARAPDHAEAPGDDLVTVELVHDPTKAGADLGSGLSHLVIKVESLGAAIAGLAAQGIDAEAPGSPDGADDFRTTWVTDPDGHRVELVQWPAGHPGGITAADLPD